MIRVSPVHEYTTLLMEAQLAAGKKLEARRTMRVIREAQEVERSRGVNTDAELAIFEAEHGDVGRAVALGREAVGVAPSVGAADAYAWALAQAGRGREALTWARRATRLDGEARSTRHGRLAARPQHITFKPHERRPDC